MNTLAYRCGRQGVSCEIKKCGKINKTYGTEKTHEPGWVWGTKDKN